MKIKKVILLVIFSTILIHKATAQQNSYIQNRWNIKLGYSKMPTIIRNYRTSNVRTEVNYGVWKFVEAGTYFEYSRVDAFWLPAIIDTSHWGAGYSKKVNRISFGINANIHVLPFFIDKPDFRFDLYIPLKLGAIYPFSQDATTPTSIMTKEYSIGGGFAFYPFKHVGLFVEYSYGYYWLPSLKFLRFGLSGKF